MPIGPSKLVSRTELRLGVFPRKDPRGLYTRFSRIKEATKEQQHLSLANFMR